jgi:hypothetical protein
MPEKSVTHGIIAGTVKYQRKRPRLSLAGQAPSEPVQRADEVPFTPISQPGKNVG